MLNVLLYAADREIERERERYRVCVERERETGKTKKLSIPNNHERKLGLQRHCCSMDLGYFSFLHR